jgi:hypothetical protein
MSKRGSENIGHISNRKLSSMKFKNRYLLIGWLRERIGKIDKTKKNKRIASKAIPTKKTRKIKITTKITIKAIAKIINSKNKSKLLRKSRK